MDETYTDAAPVEAPAKDTPADPKKSPAFWRTALAESEKAVEGRLAEWRENVAFRVIQPFGSAGDSERIAVPEDWTRTRQKQAQLSFQLPKIVALGERPHDRTTAPQVSALVNRVLRRECRAQYALDEALADVINATGLAAIHASVENVEQATALPPLPAQGVLPGLGADVPDLGTPVPETGAPTIIRDIVARRYTTNRVATQDLRWPQEFAGSDWDKSPWLGYVSHLPLESVKKHPIWGPKLPKEFAPSEYVPESLAKNLQTGVTGSVPCVRVTTIYYWARLFDSDAFHPEHLRVIVFIAGVPDPVEHGDLDEQTWVPKTAPTPGPDGQVVPGQPGYYRGLRRYPIRIETLTYVSDMAVPPSDSRAGRSQVMELMRSRQQALAQRDTSIPMRWFDVNRVDASVQEALKTNTWQGWIPMNGPGDRAIGEVARANYPRENHGIQLMIANDLDKAWALSNNAVALPNATERSATEVNAVNTASDILLDYQKGRINRLVAGVADVLWSLMQRYTTAPEYVEMIGDDGEEALQPVDPSVFDGNFAFDFVPDTSDRQDIGTKQANFEKLMNLVGKADFVNKKKLGEEAFRLLGYEPKQFIIQPTEPPPPPPNVSYRFSGEDLLNPMAAAIMLKTQQVTPQDIEAAAQMIGKAIQEAKTSIAGAALAPGLAPPAAPAPVQSVDPAAPIEPPDAMEPIRKRTESGAHMT